MWKEFDDGRIAYAYNAYLIGIPIDLLGDAKQDRYKVAIEACLEDDGVDGLLIIYTDQAVAESEKISETIVKIENLINDIEEMGLHQGLEKSLTSKLKNAIKSLENGNIDDAINQLNAFINLVEAQRGKKLTEE